MAHLKQSIVTSQEIFGFHEDGRTPQQSWGGWRLVRINPLIVYTLPETDIAPEALGLEDEFPFGVWPVFRGEPLVSGRDILHSLGSEHLICSMYFQLMSHHYAKGKLIFPKLLC